MLITFDLSNPFVVAGLLIGGMSLFVWSGNAFVGRAGGAVVIEVHLKNTRYNERKKKARLWKVSRSSN